MKWERFKRGTPIVTSSPLREQRLANNMSVCELARKAGVSHSTISRIERQGRTPRQETLRKLAEALGVEPSTLVR